MNMRKQLGDYKYRFFEKMARKLVKYNIDLGIATPDRALLEQKILPFFAADADYQSVLFVGCEWYTRQYNGIFKERDYYTMEMDGALAPYGADQHIIDKIENIQNHFKTNQLDLVLCNGVYGWGLNAQADIEKAFHGIYESLRPGGIFMLGWNDAEGHRPVPLSIIESLKRFNTWSQSPLDTDSFVANVKTGHTYNFYQKPL